MNTSNIEFYDFKENMALSESLDTKNVEHPKVKHVSREFHYGASFFEEGTQDNVGLAKKIVNKKTNKTKEKRLTEEELTKPDLGGGNDGNTHQGHKETPIGKENNGEPIKPNP